MPLSFPQHALSNEPKVLDLRYFLREIKVSKNGQKT